MSSLKTFFVGVIIFFAFGLSLALPAEIKSLTVETNSISFTISFRNEEAASGEIIHWVYMLVNTNTVRFALPQGFRVETTKPGQIILVRDDYSHFLKIRIRSFLQESSGPERYRKVLTEQFPGARILDEFSQTSDFNIGRAFDLQWSENNGMVQSARIAFIPSRLGIFEFTLLSPASKFAEGKKYFSSLLWSYGANPGSQPKVGLPPGQKPSS